MLFKYNHFLLEKSVQGFVGIAFSRAKFEDKDRLASSIRASRQPTGRTIQNDNHGPGTVYYHNSIFSCIKATEASNEGSTFLYRLNRALQYYLEVMRGLVPMNDFNPVSKSKIDTWKKQEF